MKKVHIVVTASLTMSVMCVCTVWCSGSVECSFEQSMGHNTGSGMLCTALPSCPCSPVASYLCHQLLVSWLCGEHSPDTDQPRHMSAFGISFDVFTCRE